MNAYHTFRRNQPTPELEAYKRGRTAAQRATSGSDFENVRATDPKSIRDSFARGWEAARVNLLQLQADRGAAKSYDPGPVPPPSDSVGEV